MITKEKVFTNVTIKKAIMPNGLYGGVPCLCVDLRGQSKEGSDKPISQLFEELLVDSNNIFKNILILGSIEQKPEIRDVIVGLNNKGKNVYLQTDFNDLIEVVRSLKNVNVLLQIVDLEEVDYKNIPLLKTGDEIKFDVKDLSDYEKVKQLLEAKLLTKPTVVFKLTKENDKYKEVLSQYFNDLRLFKFPNRICF